jgi:dephospho-CoA kinase
MILGITGGTGCGKTTLLELIRQAGGVVLDCDAIYHELLRQDRALLEAIESRFPGTVEEGVLQRKKLGTIVFGDRAALEDLNRITHGAIDREIQRRLTPEPKLAAIDAIALLESGIGKRCHVTVAVTAPEEVRVARIMARDGIGEAYARARIQAQPSNEYFSEKCDYTLENAGTSGEFQGKCLAFLRQLDII